MEGARAFAVSMKSRRNLSDSRRRFRGIVTQAGFQRQLGASLDIIYSYISYVVPIREGGLSKA